MKSHYSYTKVDKCFEILEAPFGTQGSHYSYVKVDKCLENLEAPFMNCLGISQE
jgi:hypothetical protein